MKKLLAMPLAAMMLAGCYDDYIKDYDTTGAYFAYQYDLRTFVVGEGMSFDVAVALTGVMDNGRDRKVTVVEDPSIVTGDLSVFGGEGSFTAYNGMMGTAPVGTLSQGYVTTAVSASGHGSLAAAPSSYYSIDGLGSMSIRKGRHTAVATVRADSLAVVSDPDMLGAYYALGLRITQADVDEVPVGKSFAVIAMRLENKYFGDWYHGGVTRVLEADGSERSRVEYPTTVPQSEDRMYVLTTRTASSVTTNRRGNGSGTLTLSFDGDDITVSGADNLRSWGDGSRANGARLLQDRKLYLNYQYDNTDGSTTVVTDTLTFRNRVRDGVNEWQDENPEHYK